MAPMVATAPVVRPAVEPAVPSTGAAATCAAAPTPSEKEQNIK